MEIEELFRKLKPVLGDKAQALWLDYHLNPERHREIHGLLQALAAKRLGETFIRKEILLLPPPPEVAEGAYRLGDVYYGSKRSCSFGLREDEWIQHVGIFGRTGSGKTNLGFLITKRLLAAGKPVLIFDWKRNYRDLFSLPWAKGIKVFTVGRDICVFQFNPLIPPAGTSPSVWLKKLIEIICHVYWLGEGVAYLLQKALDAVYQEYGVYQGQVDRWPTFADVKQWLEDYQAKGREAQWMDSTRRAIGALCYGEMGNVLNTRQPVFLQQLLKNNVVFELDALTNLDKTFFIESLLLWIHHYRLQDKGRETFKHAIIIEEAHHVLLRRKESKESIMDIILREIRELGEAIILIDQHPSLISTPSLGNTYCTMAMNLKHSRDVNAIASAMLVDKTDKEYLGRLPVGWSIVRLQGRYYRPFLVKFPLLEVKKGTVTDEQLKRRMQGVSVPSREIQPQEEKPEDLPVLRRAEKVRKEERISYQELCLLVDVMQHPTSGIAERYKRLQLSVYKGNKLRDELVANGYVSVTDISTGKGRIKLLTPTDRGRWALRRAGYEPRSAGKGGPEHEYWKHRIADALKKAGYEVETERPLEEGHQTDIAAHKGGRWIAVEVETGESDIVGNIRKNLKVGFDKVICAATSKQTQAKLKRLFDKKAVTLGNRVKLTLASQLPDELHNS